MSAIITLMKNLLLEHHGTNQTMIKMYLMSLMYFGEFVAVLIAIHFL